MISHYFASPITCSGYFFSPYQALTLGCILCSQCTLVLTLNFRISFGLYFNAFSLGIFGILYPAKLQTLESEVLAPVPAGLVEGCLVYVPFLSQDGSSLSWGFNNGTWQFTASFVSCTRVSKVRNAKAFFTIGYHRWSSLKQNPSF